MNPKKRQIMINNPIVQKEPEITIHRKPVEIIKSTKFKVNEEILRRQLEEKENRKQALMELLNKRKEEENERKKLYEEEMNKHKEARKAEFEESLNNPIEQTIEKTVNLNIESAQQSQEEIPKKIEIQEVPKKRKVKVIKKVKKKKKKLSENKQEENIDKNDINENVSNINDIKEKSYEFNKIKKEIIPKGINQRQINERQINQIQINQGEINQRQINQIQINQRQINQFQINQGDINQRQINQIQINQGGMNQRQINPIQINERQIYQLQITKPEENNINLKARVIKKGEVNPQKIENEEEDIVVYRNIRQKNYSEQAKKKKNYNRVVVENQYNQEENYNNRNVYYNNLEYNNLAQSYAEESRNREKLYKEPMKTYESDNDILNNQTKNRYLNTEEGGEEEQEIVNNRNLYLNESRGKNREVRGIKICTCNRRKCTNNNNINNNYINANKSQQQYNYIPNYEIPVRRVIKYMMLPEDDYYEIQNTEPTPQEVEVEKPNYYGEPTIIRKIITECSPDNPKIVRNETQYYDNQTLKRRFVRRYEIPQKDFYSSVTFEPKKKINLKYI